MAAALFARSVAWLCATQVALRNAVALRSKLGGFEVSADATLRGEDAQGAFSEHALRDEFEAWFVECVRRNPDWWLPVECGLFAYLQASERSADATRGTHAYEWRGIIVGGAVSSP